jgi:hypothetical protein
VRLSGWPSWATDKGLLKELVDGSRDEAKQFLFDYDATQGNKNVKLVKVTDPRHHATRLAYLRPPEGDDPKFKLRAQTITDRRGHCCIKRSRPSAPSTGGYERLSRRSLMTVLGGSIGPLEGSPLHLLPANHDFRSDATVPVAADHQPPARHASGGRRHPMRSSESR